MRFLDAVKRQDGRNTVIADIKCFSPKEGDLMCKRDPVDVALRLEKAGAKAISVVTEEKSFRGSLKMLRDICAAVSIPVLRKDFVVSEKDLYETKESGASAILLMCSCLERDVLSSLYSKAKQIGLDVLVETHTEEELHFAAGLNAGMIGINNRDITRLERDNGDVSTTERLCAFAPKDAFIISESSVETADDVRRAVKAGANAVLVGTAILRADNTESFFRMLCRRTKIKICGITDKEGVELCCAEGADVLGFVVNYPVSVPWNISKENARELLAMVRRGHKSCVVTGGNADDIISLARLLQPDVIQLHYRETLSDTEKIAAALKQDGIGVIKTLPTERDEMLRQFGTSDIAEIALLCENAGVCGVLVDPRQHHNASQSGLSAPTEVFRTLSQKLKAEAILAGGIDGSSIFEVIQKTGAESIDVMTGSEDAPGRKNRDKIKAILSQSERTAMKKGRFGIHGGQYIPETLMNAVGELERAYKKYKDDPDFNAELSQMLCEYAGRPSRLYFAERMTKYLGGAKIYLKREDLNHTGAHKINNVIGQMLLAKRMGKTRVIAETGAGQHGVATATVAAMMGMECEIYMGRTDCERQALNVYRMRLLGAKVHPVDSGTATLKDAVSETFREWTSRIDDTHYVLGSVMGPYPFPEMVRDFQAVISKEIKEQLYEKEGRLPDAVVACVGGGSNAIGAFYNFIGDKSVRLIGCEAAGRGIDTPETAATINTGRLGIFHGMKSYFCQDDFGQIAPVYSISAGLDYPGIGPEHANLYDTGRAQYVGVTDAEAVEAFEYLSKTEGIIPAIESAHAVAYALKEAPKMGKDKIMVINISGRGDKDCAAIARYKGEDLYE